MAFEQLENAVEGVYVDENSGASYNGKTEHEKKSEELFDSLKTMPNAYINVHRQPNGGNKPMEFVCRVDADKYDIGQLQAFLQENFGGGEYRVMGYAAGKLRANNVLYIASRVQSVQSRQEISPMQSIIVQMAEMQKQILQQLASKPVSGVSEMRREILEDIKSMRDLFGGQSSPSNGIEGILTTVSALKSLGLNVGLPEGGGDDNWSSLIEKFMPFATALASRPPEPVAQVPVRRLQRAQPNIGHTREMGVRPKINQPVERKVMTPEEKALHQGIGILVAGAESGGDPGDYADLVLSNVPPEVLEPMFTDPAAVDNLAKINQKVNAHREWFVDLGEHIKACLGFESKFSDLYEGDEADSLNQSAELDDNNASTSNVHDAGNT